MRSVATRPTRRISAFIGALSARTLATMVVAVQHALDYRSTGRALAVVVVGWIVAMVMFVVIGGLFSPTVS